MQTMPLASPERLWARTIDEEIMRLVARMLFEVRASCDDHLAGVSDTDLLGLMEDLLGDFFRKEAQC